MIFRQMFDSVSSTYTYLIADEKNRNACLIDPVLEKIPLYQQLLSDLDLKLTHALDTHVHADHITALGELRDANNCLTMVGSSDDVACASSGLKDGETILIGDIEIHVLFTPGHTSDSYSFYIPGQDEGYLFSGDTLLIRGTGRTDFQNGDSKQLFNSLHSILLALPDNTWVYPGHDYKGWTRSTIAEEKQHNPRINLPSEEAFVEHMNNLNLPNPKMMDIAVPANLACGKAFS
jgi:glyoxylase-like metal-dependent hydrolase (beta-lactamase superfamily II)